jgi:hypothetical protein
MCTALARHRPCHSSPIKEATRRGRAAAIPPQLAARAPP